MGIKLTGLNSGLDTDSIVKELMSAHSLKLTKIENKKTTNTWTQDKWKELNKKIYALYTDELSKARLATSYQTKKASTSNADCLEITATTKAVTGAHRIKINQLASAQYVTGEQTNIESLKTKLAGSDGVGFEVGDTITIKDKEFTIEENSTVDDFIKACKEQGINASFDTSQKRIFLSSSSSGRDQAFELKSSNTDALTNGLGLGTITVGSDGGVTQSNDKMSVEKAQDAVIVLDGATLTSSTNEPEINGLKLKLKQVTTSEATITVSNDTKAVYDMVSNLIKGYNNILGAMNEAYYANSAKGYEPLTEEEREAMSEDQIEKWESKIKDSLLRRDSTLGTMLTAFKSAMNIQVEASDGKTYSLSSLGISTSKDYTERGLLHIKGDSEDTTYSDQSNTLMSMLEENPEIVTEVMKGIASNLYDTMSKKMASSSISSALTFYNDKKLSKQDTEYDKQIEKMKDKLQDLEERYYKQFTAMETAMAKLNAQQSSLSSLLGM